MSSNSPTAASARPEGRRRLTQILLWIGQGVLFVQFAIGGTLKLVGHESMTTMFEDIGAGDGLRFVVGVLELLGAVSMLIRPATAAGALGLVLLMIGAGITNVAVLNTSPAMPIVLLVVAAAVAWGRRDQFHELAQMQSGRRTKKTTPDSERNEDYG